MGEADGVEGGVVVAAAATVQPWAPKDTDELFSEIATMDYGVSDDRSSKLATPAIKAYNKVAGTYEQAWQKRGQPLLDGFTIVKVRCMHRLRPLLANRTITSPHDLALGCHRRLPVSRLDLHAISTSSTRSRAYSSPRQAPTDPQAMQRHVSPSHTAI